MAIKLMVITKIMKTVVFFLFLVVSYTYLRFRVDYVA